MRLTNERAEVEVDLVRGGRISSLVVDGCSVLAGQPSDGGGDVLSWGAYVMAPWAGRVRDGVVEFAGQRHRLPVRGGRHALHGTVVDRPWEQVADGMLRTDLGPDWPWAGHVEQRIALDSDGVTLDLAVVSDGDSFPASAGWHPWFLRRLPGVAGAGELEFDVRPLEAWEVDAELLPTGQIVSPPSQPWDTPFAKLAGPPLLRWPGALEVTVESKADCWVLYTEPDHAVCVEPQTARPDALSSDDVAIVSPGQPLHASMRLTWRSLRGSQ